MTAKKAKPEEGDEFADTQDFPRIEAEPICESRYAGRRSEYHAIQCTRTEHVDDDHHGFYKNELINWTHKEALT